MKILTGLLIFVLGGIFGLVMGASLVTDYIELTLQEPESYEIVLTKQ